MNSVAVTGRLRAADRLDAARVAWLGQRSGMLALLSVDARSTELPVVFDVPPVGALDGARVHVDGWIVSPVVVYDLGLRRQLYQPRWVQVGQSRMIAAGAPAVNSTAIAGTVVSVRPPWSRRGLQVVNAALVVPDERAGTGQVLVSAVVELSEREPPPWLRTGAELTVTSGARIGVGRYSIGGRRRFACTVECSDRDLRPSP